MIDVSERAAKRIQEIIVEGKCEFSGLRVGLRDGGCAGYTYLLEFEPKPDEDDTVIVLALVRPAFHRSQQTDLAAYLAAG